MTTIASKWYEDEPLNSFKFNYKSKKKNIQTTFDPFTFSISLLIFICILSCIVFYLIYLQNEIEFYHQVVAQQNQTIYQIENKILNQILNDDNMQKINTILYNIERISTQFNITQIQNNLQDIAKVINHYAPPPNI
jgi:hypothetical protein